MIINSIIGGNGGETASIFVTGLSETDTVTATKDGKSYSGKWVSKPNPAYVVPDGYTQLEYIESTGTQYIDTGFIPNQDTRLELVTSPMSTADAAQGTGFIPYGSGKSYSSNAFECYTVSNKFEINYGNQYDIIGTAEIGTTIAIDHNKNNVSIKQDSQVVASYVFNYVAFSAPYNLTLFGINRGSITCGLLKLYSCKIYDNGTLIRNYIPCKNTAGEIGLWDDVNSVFYSNMGTGTFVAGAEVPQTIDGFLIDSIKSYGTYTITATDGTNTATQDVLVDMAIQYDIEMSYFNGLKLYWLGDECEDVTGGWSNSGYSRSGYTQVAITKSDTNILVKSPANSNESLAGTANKINLSKYSKIRVNVISYSGNAFHFAILNTKSIGSWSYSGGVVKDKLSITTTGTVDFDITDVNGEYYFIIFADNSSSGVFDMVWLE